MPFDGSDFQRRRQQPGRSAPSENTVSILITLLALILLTMPFSLAGLIDIIQYMHAR